MADYSGVRGVISIWSPLKDRALVWKRGSHSHQCPNPDPALTFSGFRINGLSSQRSRAMAHSTSGLGKGWRKPISSKWNGKPTEEFSFNYLMPRAPAKCKTRAVAKRALNVYQNCI